MDCICQRMALVINFQSVIPQYPRTFLCVLFFNHFLVDYVLNTVLKL